MWISGVGQPARRAGYILLISFEWSDAHNLLMFNPGADAQQIFWIHRPDTVLDQLRRRKEDYSSSAPSGIELTPRATRRLDFPQAPEPSSAGPNSLCIP